MDHDTYTAHLAHLESQLLISDATHSEEQARLVAELEAVYAENEVLRRAGGGNSSVGDPLVFGEEMRRREEQWRRELVELQADNEHLEETLRLLTIDFQTLTSQHGGTLQHLRASEASVESLDARYGEMHDAHESLRQDYEILQDDYADLKNEVGLLHAEKRGLKSTVGEQRDRVTALEAERQSLTELRNQLSSLEASNARLTAHLTTLESTNERLTAHITTLESTNATLTEKTLKAEQDRLQVQVERVEATLARDATEETLRELQAYTTSLESDRRTLEAEHQGLATDLAAARGENGRLELRVEKLRVEETRLRDELKTSKADRAGLMKRVKEVERGLKEAEREGEEVRRVRDELRDELQGVRGALEVEKGTVGRLEAEVEEGKGVAQQLQGELKDVTERLASSEASLPSANARITSLESDLSELETTRAALDRTNATLTADLKRTTAELGPLRKELVPLRLERDAARNEGKRLASERNLLKNRLERVLREGAGEGVTAVGGTDVSLTALQAEHATTLAALASLETTHESATQEITRLHEEREEFKRYIDWVRPDREKLKDDLKHLRSAFEQSEAEKQLLMTEVTKYLAQQQEVKPPVAPVAAPAKNGQQQYEQLVQALGIIEQEFTRYRARVEEELAEAKSGAAQAEMEKSMVEEEFERARHRWEAELDTCRRELEARRVVVPPLTREIHALVAGFLAGDNAFRSLANLTAVSREVRQTTMPILYETLVLDDDEDEDWAYGTRVDLVAGLVLPSGWEFVKHLFMSHRHHDRIKTIIHAAQTPTVYFLAIAFPHLKFHMTYHMRKLADAGRPPEYKRDCTLVIHRPVDTAVFHGILTTLPLRCWLPAAVVNGIAPVKQESVAPPDSPAKEPKLTRMGLVNGITEIRFLPPGRFVNRTRSTPGKRYYHHGTDLSLSLGFTQDDRTVQCTLYELARLFKRDQPTEPVPKDIQRHLSCHDVSTRVYHALVLAICRIVPESIHDIHITIHLSRYRSDPLTFLRIEDLFSVAVRLFSDMWLRIPLARRDDRAKHDAEPMFQLIGFTRDDVRVEGSIRPTPGSRGSTFVANIQARVVRDSTYRSTIYPAVFPTS